MCPFGRGRACRARIHLLSLRAAWPGERESVWRNLRINRRTHGKSPSEISLAFSLLGGREPRAFKTERDKSSALESINSNHRRRRSAFLSRSLAPDELELIICMHTSELKMRRLQSGSTDWLSDGDRSQGAPLHPLPAFLLDLEVRRATAAQCVLQREPFSPPLIDADN